MATNVEALDTHIQRAMPISRVLRLLVGLAVVFLVLQIFSTAPAGWILRSVAAALAFVPFYAGVHHLVGTCAPRLNRWIGALVAVTPVALVFFMGPSWGRVGALLFVAVSLVLTAILGDPGCEGHGDSRALLPPAHASGLYQFHTTGLGGRESYELVAELIRTPRRVTSRARATATPSTNRWRLKFWQAPQDARQGRPPEPRSRRLVGRRGRAPECRLHWPPRSSFL